MNPYAPPREAEVNDAAEAEGAPPTASVMRRLLARLVDLAVGFVVGAPLAALLVVADAEDPAKALSGAALAALFAAPLTSVVVIALRWDDRAQSLGKSLLGVQVVDAQTGAPAGFVRGVLAREILLLVLLVVLGLCAAPLLIVLLSALSFTKHRAPHDWIAETQVVRRRGR